MPLLRFGIHVALALLTTGDRWVETRSIQEPASAATEEEQYRREFASGVQAIQAGKLAEGIASFEHCLVLRPRDGLSAYNLACAHSLGGRIEQGIAWLERAAEWGHHDVHLVASDPDLASLRPDARFATILTRMREADQQAREREAREREQRMRSLLAEEAVRSTTPTIDWLAGHRRAVISCQYFPDGTRIVTASRDGTARVWDAEQGETLLTLASGAESVGLVLSPNGERLLAKGPYVLARLWDTGTGELLALLGQPGGTTPCAAFSPDGTRVTTGSERGDIEQWDALTGTWIRYLGRVPGFVRSLAYSPDGARLVLADSTETVRIWDAASGEEHLVVEGHGMGKVGLALVDALILSGPSGLRRVDPATGAETRMLESSSDRDMRVAISPGGAYVAASTSAGLRMWERATWRPLYLLELDGGWSAFAFNAQGDEVTVAVGTSVSTHDARTGSLRMDTVLDSWVYCVASSPDGQSIAAGCEDGSVRILEARSGQERVRLGGSALALGGVRFSSDGQRLALVSLDGSSEWSTLTGERLAPTGTLRSIAPEGQDPEPDRVRALTTPLSENYSWDPAVQAPIHLAEREPLHAGGGSRMVVFARDGSRLATNHLLERNGEMLPRIEFWDAAGARLGRMESAETMSLVLDFDRAGERAVLSRGKVEAQRTADGRTVGLGSVPRDLLVVNMEGTELWSREDAHGDSIIAARFSPDGRQLLSGGQDGWARLWDLESSAEVARLDHHGSWVKSVAFDRDGRRALTGCQDGSLRLWSLPDGGELLSTRVDGIVEDVALSPTGDRIAVAGSDGVARLCHASSGELLATFVALAGGEGLCFTPSLHFVASPLAAHQAQLVLGGVTYPLELFASTLQKDEEVRAALAGRLRTIPAVPTPPSLELLSPAEREVRTTERSVRLRALATDRTLGIDRIEVYQDGVPLDGKGSGVVQRHESGNRTLRLECMLEIPSGVDETTIRVQAVGERGTRSQPRSVRLRYEAPRSDLYLLALGVSDYDDDALDLACPVADVDGVVSAFTAQREELFGEVHVERLVNAQVSAAQVRRLREEFLRRAQPEDTIVVFAAGHGLRTDAGEYYFLTHDASPTDPYAGIDRATLESLVTWDKLHASRRVLLIDTCQAGSTLVAGTRGDARGLSAYSQKEVDTRLDESRGGLYIIAASSEEGFAREQEGNGLFTRALLDGLAGGADEDRDGYVTIEELKRYSSREVHEKSAGRQRPTVPSVVGGEDFRIGRVLMAGGAAR